MTPDEETERHAPSPSMFDFNPSDVCPECHLIRARNGKCACQL